MDHPLCLVHEGGICTRRISICGPMLMQFSFVHARGLLRRFHSFGKSIQITKSTTVLSDTALRRRSEPWDVSSSVLALQCGKPAVESVSVYSSHSSLYRSRCRASVARTHLPSRIPYPRYRPRHATKCAIRIEPKNETIRFFLRTESK